MSLHVFNSATDTKELFEPLTPGQIRMYVCGVTVYDYCHIGHARSAISFDIIYRYLKYRFPGHKTTFVRNFTDIDDKIIKRAHESGISWQEVTTRFIAAFYEDMDALGLARPEIEPKATGHIPEMIALTTRLLENGLAYETGGDVYFDVPAYDRRQHYGVLRKQALDDLQAGARVETDERKQSPLDFALWKAAKPGEPSWDSPWGKGRPGWHLECSAMSMKYLGDTFDIHGGGRDLMFPHHENEIAQSCGATGNPFYAKYWLHNGFVNIDNEKMSKSLGNFFTIREVLKLYGAEALRFLILSTHYRHPINFADSLLDDAEKRVVYFYETLLRATDAAGNTAPDEALWRRTSGDGEPDVREAFCEAMDDDFNVQRALAALIPGLFKSANAILDNPDLKPKQKAPLLAAFLQFIREFGGVLGMWQQAPGAFLQHYSQRRAEKLGIDTAAIGRLIADRTAARAAKDFTRADAIRAELAAMGVALRDGKEGTAWSLSK